MITPRVPDQTFCLGDHEHYALVNMRVFGPWPNVGAAVAGMETEQRRAKTRRSTKLAEHLEGTCNSISEELLVECGYPPGTDKLDAEAEIEEYIFICDNCGWWCAADERGEEFCLECEDSK